MSRLIFEAGRRLAAPKVHRTSIVIEPPPELPRVVPASLLRRALPILIVVLIVGMIVAMAATGMRLISPQTLFFPFVLLLAATALYRGSDNKMRTEEIDAERADYLRYLSVIRDNVRARAAEQREALLWSHPDPAGLAAIPGTRRQWERDPHAEDFLVVRAGLHDMPLDTTLRVKDIAAELDLEPVSHSALRALLEAQRTLRDAPKGIDLSSVSEITITGDSTDVRAVIRAWVAQAVIWHDPALLGVALASADLESDDWTWLKWLPHTDISGRLDGCGPARYLAATTRELVAEFEAVPADDARHYLVIIDGSTRLPDDSPFAGRAGVTVVYIGESDDTPTRYPDPERPVLRMCDSIIQRWESDGWSPYIAKPDQLTASAAAHLARRLGRWDSDPTHAGLRSAATSGASFTTLLGIADAAALDVPSLWAPRPREEELRVPIGVTTTGVPMFFDLKDEAEGGMGPHGLMIGMTGSGKSQTLMSILLSLLTTHSADRLIVIYVDFKGEAGADIFRHFPQVVAVISNMAEKKSLADRFADTLRGEVARREQLLREAGRRVQGSAFGSVAEYEAARPSAETMGIDLPALPTLFVVADEFTLMLAEHPEYAELFDYVARKGRSFRIHILFASQTLDIGRIRDIDKNTSYRIGLKVASPAVSRQIIGVEDAYHIESGREHKGIGFLVPAPGAAPIKFRSTYVDGIYDPPKQVAPFVVPALSAPAVFTAGPAVLEREVIAADVAADPPRIPRKLIATIGDQLSRFGPRAPQLWLPPLDEPIRLADVFGAEKLDEVPAGQWKWPLGQIDRPFAMRRDPLVFDAESAAGNMIIHGGPRSGKSTALTTFVLSAAELHSPVDVTFYCLDYGGGTLRDLAPLAHVGTVATPAEPERIRRTFGELDQLLKARQGSPRGAGGYCDGYGEVFLLIDNLYAFSRDNTDQFNTRNPLLGQVSELANTALAHGIHVIVTTPNWLEVPLAMRDGLGLRLELRLPDPRDSNVRVTDSLRRPAESVPADQPGRGLTTAGEHILFAQPDLARIPVINDRYPGLSAPPVRLLPLHVGPAQVNPVYPGGERIVLGQRERDLGAVIHDFAERPLMMVLGDTKSGKTTLLRHVIRTIRDNSSADDVAFTVFDRRLHLVDEPLFDDNEYTASIDRVTPAVLGLAALIEQRRPPAGLSALELLDWSEHQSGITQTHYLIIDDADQIPDGPAMSGPYAGSRPWTPLLGLLAGARELGLRLIVTGRASGSMHTLMTNPLWRRMNDLQASVVMLSGNPTDGAKIRGHRFGRLPTGRGILLNDSEIADHIQLVDPLIPAHNAAGSAHREGQQG